MKCVARKISKNSSVTKVLFVKKSLVFLQCLNMNGMSEETVDRLENLPHIDRIEVYDLIKNFVIHC